MTMQTHAHDSPLDQKKGWEWFVALVCKIIGVPDYDTYKQHMARCHPDQAPMTEAEFAEERLTTKYSKPGQRCC
jgi:uncharacterized short protein YbdD (DUF466 family)